MQEHYGIDLGVPGLLDQRKARWLTVRILGLLPIESRLNAMLIPRESGD
jgi:hypothetical protein